MYRLFSYKKSYLLVALFSLLFIVACSKSSVPNQKPVAEDLELTVDSEVEATVILKATDGDDDTLSFEVLQPSNGSAELKDGNSATYKSNAGFTGEDSFQYRAYDDKAYSDFATVKVTVNEVKQNTLPVVEAIEVSTQTDKAITITLQGSDSDGDEFSYELTSQPSNGSSGVINNGTVVYTPKSGYFGQDSFSYAAKDSEGLGTSAEVKITVTRGNTAPNVTNQQFSVQENKAVNTVVGKVVATDVEGGALTYEIVGGNAQNTFSIISASGELRLAKRPNFESQTTYALQVKVSDTGGLSTTTTVTVQIANLNYGNVIFIGDSVTRGWRSLGQPATPWPTKVQAALNMDFAGDFSATNRGVDGDTAIGLKNRLTAQVLTQNPSYVTVQIGTNDVYNNSGVAPASPTVAAFEGQVATVLQNLKAASSIKQVFVLGIISPVKSGADATFPGLIQMPQGQLDAQVAAFNAALQRQAGQRGFVYVNLAGQFPADAASRLVWLPDGVHPSEAGYQRIASVVEAQLRNQFK